MTTNAADTLAIEGGTPTRSTPFPERSIAEPAPDEQPIKTLELEFAAYLGIDAANTIAVARKSLVARRDLPAGTVLTEEMIDIKRPGNGLPPSMRPLLVGRSLRVDIAEDILFSLDLLE